MKKQKTYNLKKAIKQLPIKKAPDIIWDNISVELDKKKNLLNAAKDNLPKIKAPDKIWKNISDELDNNSLNEAIEKLPKFKAPDKIWENIDQHIEKNIIRIFLENKKHLIRIAASIALILSISIFAYYKFENKPKTKTFYSIEIINKSNKVNFEPIENTNYQYILSNCKKLPDVCKSPLFVQLKGQLTELGKEQDKLEKILKSNPDPQLLKFYYRIKNKKTDIEKRLIKMFIES